MILSAFVETMKDPSPEARIRAADILPFGSAIYIKPTTISTIVGAWEHAAYLHPSLDVPKAHYCAALVSTSTNLTKDTTNLYEGIM